MPVMTEREKSLTGDELDAEIRRVEQSLIDREERFLRTAVSLGQRMHDAVPMSLGGGAVAGLGLLSWLLRPSRASRPASSGSAPATGWGRWLGLVWPLVPQQLKARIDPRVLTLVSAIGLPLLEHLWARRRRPPRTEPEVDLVRYSGTWHEIARLPESHESACASDVTAEYRPLGRDRFSVVNRCLRPDGRPEEAVGVAEVGRSGRGSRLRVNFAGSWMRRLGLAWADYWILRVDRDYGAALVGTPDRRHLWVLSRTPELDPESYRRMVDYARLEGYDTDRLRLTPRTSPSHVARAMRRARREARGQAATA